MQDRDDHRDMTIKSSGSESMAPLGMRFPLDFDLSMGQMAQEEADQNSSSSMKGYSQKNYHIGDGTLYSVMIPHQTKQVARTYRGSTPGRGRGRGRGRGPTAAAGGARGRRQLKFHHQALPPEYLDHYVQRMNQEAASLLAQEVTAQAAREASPPQPPPERPAATAALPHLTPDVLSAACQAGRRHGTSTVRPETLSKVASVIAANSKYRQILPRPAPNRGTRTRGRGRGRGRGSRAIPGFIQEVHGSMNKGQEKILVEKSSYDGGSLFPTSVSAHLVKAIPGPSAALAAAAAAGCEPPAGGAEAAAAAAAALSRLQGGLESPLEGRHRSRKPRKADICHMVDGGGSERSPSSPETPDTPPMSMLQTLLSAKPEPGDGAEEFYSRLHEYLPMYQRLLAGAGAHSDSGEQEEPLNLCIRDLSLSDGPSVKSEPSADESPPDSPSEAAWGSDYVFWPEAGVMVHPLMLEHHWRQRAKGDAATWAGDAPDSPTDAGGAADGGSRRKKRSPAHVLSGDSASAGAGGFGSTSDVSICKFKFKGGANPSLQEKKKLSLNSDGQFRFFQNERTPPTALGEQSVASTSSERAAPSPDRKRKRAGPLEQHRQLEKKFREQGFLIQTAQTESAEGATYCKFRQLKKFTRYLFRSWRDYLPEEGEEGDTAAPSETAGSESPPLAEVKL
ncbi:uncharacterized protein LOC122381166 [Amphibalanus amphitrite]|uniref:uncharacterized protein LOC122381166 n=1 Tax=Amphibalanus amphitrite TaxID=1232801 RepID=UPI001C923870|nr:uncharacterized protein LOC122381166 [Amphibalanus amphitrite]